MDLQPLKNIFAPGGTVTSYCLVLQRRSSTRYDVIDATGRTTFADSTDFYPPGVGVVVQNGRIIGRGSAAGKHKFYEV